jgi:hypothetical protein
MGKMNTANSDTDSVFDSDLTSDSDWESDSDSDADSDLDFAGARKRVGGASQLESATAAYMAYMDGLLDATRDTMRPGTSEAAATLRGKLDGQRSVVPFESLISAVSAKLISRSIT